MAAKKATKTKVVEPARSKDEAEELVGEIGRLDRKVTVLEAAMNDALAAVKERYALEVGPLNAKIEETIERVHLFAEAGREELCRDGSKSVLLGTGELAWRMPPPTVRIQAQDVVLERLRKRGLEEFIRTKEEVNKEAILATPEKVAGIAGITIDQKEKFVVKPFESQLERAVLAKSA